MKALLLIPLLLTGMLLSALEIAPDDPRIRIDGCAFRETVDSKLVRMSRKIPHPDFSQWENPGALIRLRTNAKTIRFRIRQNPLFPGKKKNTIFVCRIIGKNGNVKIVDSRNELKHFRLEGDGSMQEYEFAMPLNGSYDFLGIGLGGNARLEKPLPKKKRIVFYGDDLLFGKAESVAETVPFQVAGLNRYDAVDMSFSRILLTPWHGEFLREIPMNALVVLIGLRDAEFGTSSPVFRKNLERFIEEVRKRKSSLKLVFIAPFQCAGKTKLTPVRKEIMNLKGENLKVIDGALLIPSDPSFFEKDRRTLNRKGLRLFSENLAKVLRSDRFLR